MSDLKCPECGGAPRKLVQLLESEEGALREWWAHNVQLYCDSGHAPMYVTVEHESPATAERAARAAWEAMTGNTR